MERRPPAELHVATPLVPAPGQGEPAGPVGLLGSHLRLGLDLGPGHGDVAPAEEDLALLGRERLGVVPLPHRAVLEQVLGRVEDLRCPLGREGVDGGEPGDVSVPGVALHQGPLVAGQERAPGLHEREERGATQDPGDQPLLLEGEPDGVDGGSPEEVLVAEVEGRVRHLEEREDVVRAVLVQEVVVEVGCSPSSQRWRVSRSIWSTSRSSGYSHTSRFSRFENCWTFM